MDFKKFFTDYDKNKTAKVLSEEDYFLEAVGTQIPSLNGFMAWLILNKKIKPYIMSEQNRPISLYTLPYNKKILYLAKNLDKIKELAEEFSSKWAK